MRAQRGLRERLLSPTAILGMILAFALSGCTSQTPEEQVTTRAQARLDALMAGDFEKAFSYLAPALREASSVGRYGSRYAGVVNWKEARVESVVCEPERCDVKSSVRYEIIRPRFENTRSFEEVWIEIGGVWYIYDT